ncbi:DUF397 domain-containing protein [Streptomyces sp. NPDC002490]|uniref:DUF397 domain-containing protein n=1 Tax=Streptomyces sp. NPDC002490 TaxID=3154416 RepID=UPI00332C9F76
MDSRWVKSSYSTHQANCVEVRTQHGQVAFRDSKRTTGPVVSVAAPSWKAFVADLPQADHA